MPVSVVVGGQFGSEGKGKVSLEIVRRDQSVVAAVRVGGTNSGHTGIGADRKARALSQLPAAAPGQPHSIHRLPQKFATEGRGVLSKIPLAQLMDSRSIFDRMPSHEDPGRPLLDS